MINFDYVTKENMKEHNPWPKIPDHPYRILIDDGNINFTEEHQPDATENINRVNINESDRR